MTIRTIEVTQIINISLDESKFTKGFMEEFRENFYQFNTIEDHRKHLAQLFSRGLVDNMTDFIEGYGETKGMGISFELEYQKESSIF